MVERAKRPDRFATLIPLFIIKVETDISHSLGSRQ